MTRRNRKQVAEQEAEFLVAYYGKTSPTRLDRRASAVAAGFTPRMAVWNANRVIKKFADKGFRECAEAVGITTPALAVMFKEVLETAEGKEALATLRLAMANRGETVDGAGAKPGATVNNNMTMIFQGFDRDRLGTMLRGGEPELPAASEQDVMDVEVLPETVEPAKHERVEQADARKLAASDFAGPNRGDVG